MSGVDFPSVSLKIRGVTPLLMHNEQLANPMSPATKRLKALTGKRKKTDDDVREIARAEFAGGLYLDESGPFIPVHWILAMLRDGGKMEKLGKAVTQGVLILEDSFPLDIPIKDRTEEGLWNAGFYDQRMVGNQKARVLRTRPKFDKWSIECVVHYDPSIFNGEQILRIAANAGVKVGLGDYRPRYGRFVID